MLRLSAQTAAGRVDDAWALCNRLPASLVALEQGRITLSKARILHAETANLSDAHTAEVEQQVLANAHRQTPEQLRVATRVGWMDARRGDALVDLVLDPTGYCSAGTKAAPGALEACRRRRWR